MAEPDTHDHDGEERIDVADADAINDWARKLDVTAEQIVEAVAAVGDQAADVELHLKGSRSTTNSERVVNQG